MVFFPAASCFFGAWIRVRVCLKNKTNPNLNHTPSYHLYASRAAETNSRTPYTLAANDKTECTENEQSDGNKITSEI